MTVRKNVVATCILGYYLIEIKSIFPNDSHKSTPKAV
ncbi:hypothetical protein MICAE_960026 [Microcystis aeruginosa PCC 9806]|uniref:Uncharacterized protein n=1 Tax=Microcystis aeruginosa PCC 9806 TaxID=1160282 RepID=I4H3T2_MICAE|nr:hypothetical protein MICAE_960026 [Microcystis aeruginosa PCC 9806]